MCVYECVVLEAYMGGDRWWAREIRDNLMLSAFCLLHAVNQQHKLLSGNRTRRHITPEDHLGQVELRVCQLWEVLHVTRAQHL